MRWRHDHDAVIGRPLIGLAVACAAIVPAFADNGHHYIYTLDNAQADNRVVVLEQESDGSLVNAGSISTLGAGLGAGLGSQGALALSQNGRWLFAVSAASNQITTFAIDDDKIEYVATTLSGGTTPISVTSHGNLLYVLNAGGTGSVPHRAWVDPRPGLLKSNLRMTPSSWS